MEYSEIIYLISETTETDDIGNNVVKSVVSTKSYAKKQSVRTNEFYDAATAGYKPTCEFVIKKLNYNNERELTWNGKHYSVIRVVEPKNKFDIVLVCSEKIGVN